MAAITRIKYIKNADEIPEDIIEKLYSVMSSDRKMKADRYVRKGERVLNILSYALMALLFKEEGYDIAGRPFIFTKSGKPYFDSPLPHFNMSHSHGAASCALSTVPVGIDIQKYEKEMRYKSRRLILTENEKKTIEGVPDAGIPFIKYWTLKECFGKMTGDGVFNDDVLGTDYSDYLEKERFVKDDSSYISLDVGGYYLSACTERETDFEVCETCYEELSNALI